MWRPSGPTSVIRCIYDLPLKSYWTVIACEREAADAPNRMHQAREPEPNLSRPARPRIAADLRGRSRYGLLTPFRTLLGPAAWARATSPVPRSNYTAPPHHARPTMNW